jgi:hypothetical protein
MKCQHHTSGCFGDCYDEQPVLLCGGATHTLRTVAKRRGRGRLEEKKETQLLVLILHELRRDIWPPLVDVFQEEPGIELSQEADWAFNSRRDLDAIVLNERFAYEQYGGMPYRQVAPHIQVGEAQVLSTREPHVLSLYAPPNVPPWVVALPPIYERVLPMEAETAVIWQRILATCGRLNASNAMPKIQRLGCTLQVNFWPAGTTDAERIRDLQSVRRAYREHRRSR